MGPISIKKYSKIIPKCTGKENQAPDTFSPQEKQICNIIVHHNVHHKADTALGETELHTFVWVIKGLKCLAHRPDVIKYE